jgi:Protein of unknown function (DUF2384)
MSQPAFHDVQKIGDGAASVVAHPRLGGVFSVFGSSNTLVSTAQLTILTVVEVKAAMMTVGAITLSSISFSGQASSISFSGQDKMLTRIRDEDLGERVKARRTGPVQVLGKIATDWQLSYAELASLLAYPDSQSAADLLDGRASLRNPDREDRVRLLYRIYRVLSSLFPDVARQQAWLRATNENLRNKSPLEFMMERRIPGMISVQNLVERLVAR